MADISSLKSLDRVFGRCLCSLLPRPRPRGINNIIRVLVVRPGGIGDAVMLAPALHFLKKSYPDCHITILAEQRNAGVFPLVPGAGEVLCYDRPHEFFQALRDHFDVVIDTEQSYRLSAVVAWLVRAPVKIGFDTNERRRMFTHRIRYDMTAYEPDNFASLFEPLGVSCQRDTGVVTLKVPSLSESKARLLLQPLGAGPFVVIFPGASIPEKRWGTDRFCTVAKRLVANGYNVVVVGGRDDSADGDMVAGSGGINLAGMTTLAETAAVIARSTLVISGDSGVLHMAAGLDIPTVSLFGPSSMNKWAPQGEKHVVINHRLPCSPCSRFGTIPPCPINARCLKDITPDEVMEAVGRLLSQPPEER